MVNYCAAQPKYPVFTIGSVLQLREAIQKKMSEKGREGVGLNPHFYIRIIWDPTLREGGAKLLFPKSNILFGLVVGVKSKFYSEPKSYIP